MAHIRTFQDLKVWQKANALAVLVYTITNRFPSDEKFGLTTQLRRASVSVASNIVEGFRRKSLKDSLHFYKIADGSLEELKYQLLLSHDIKLLSDDTYTLALSLSEEVSKMLYFWIKSLKSKIN